jgi:hypothetical protein
LFCSVILPSLCFLLRFAPSLLLFGFAEPLFRFSALPNRFSPRIGFAEASEGEAKKRRKSEEAKCGWKKEHTVKAIFIF